MMSRTKKHDRGGNGTAVRQGVLVAKHTARGAAVIQKSSGVLASSKASQNLKFERGDWTLFRTIEGLQQKAGVSKDLLARLVLKELADNGLDENAKVRVGELPEGRGWYVEDDGPGIDGTPDELAQLFSIARPMRSTKLLRLPTRGALGNGLRVVGGAVLASKGSLTVITRNKRIELRPERDGSTTVVKTTKVKFPIGTRVEISLGSALKTRDTHTLSWARTACNLARFVKTYLGKSSPHWYDAPHFHELLDASGNTPVRELISSLDGCTGPRAGEIVLAARLDRALCKNVTRPQAEKLLRVARQNARPVKPSRLGTVGPDAFPGGAYACTYGHATFSDIEIPFVAEAWAKKVKDDETFFTVCVNRTPATGGTYAARDKRKINAFGCGLSDTIAEAPEDTQFDIRLNLTTPYLTFTSDGKEPDLQPFLDEIETVVGKAVRKAHRSTSGSKVSQKDIVLDNLDVVIADVSGDGEFRFNMRQIFYGLRPIIMNELDEELKIGNFTSIMPITRPSTAKFLACTASRAAASRILTATKRLRLAL